MAPNVAEVRHDVKKNVPIVDPGDLTPEVFQKWQHACDDYFTHKTLDEDKQVAHVCTGFSDLRIRDWIAADREHYKKMTFADFVKEVSKRWLPKDWEYELELKLLSMKQKDSEPFAEWVTKAENYRSGLVGTDAELDDAKFRKEIESKVCEDLRSLCRENNTKSIKGYKAWRDTVDEYDQRRMRERQRVIALINAQRSAPKENTQRSNQPRNDSPRTRPKRLSEDERALIIKHRGCYKCRRFYAGHTKDTCPNDWPAPDFPTLTEAAANAAKAKYDAKHATSSTTGTRRTVAAVNIDDPNNTPVVVAAVRTSSPTAASCSVLDYHTGSEDSDEYVAGLFAPHIHFPAVVRAGDTRTPHSSSSVVPAAIQMLIDTGSSAVLIKRDVATSCGLRLRRMYQPVPLSGAWGDSSGTASEFVKLRISSPCFSWTSKTVLAIVVDSLCAPVILGLPFLSANSLVVDPGGNTVIEKPTGRDLLHLPTPVPAPRPLTPKEARAEAVYESTKAERASRNLKQRVIIELKELFEFNVDYFAIQAPLHAETIHAFRADELRLDDPLTPSSTVDPLLVPRVRASNTVIASGVAHPLPDCGRNTVKEDDPQRPLPSIFSLFSPNPTRSCSPPALPCFAFGRLRLSNIQYRFFPPPDIDYDTAEEERAERVRLVQEEREEEARMKTTVAMVKDACTVLAWKSTMEKEETIMRTKYDDLFPEDIPPIERLPTNVYHHFRLKDPNLVIAKRQYDCPKKYREVWRTLLDEHLAAGRMRPSSSPYASPAFLIPKNDPTAKPRWVNDYRALNDNTVPDRHPLPSVNEILSDCARGKIFGKLDMTNSFFQTRVHPDDVQYTAVTTPFGLYEWLVMPQGCRNAPATHQRRMFQALRHLVGTICHVYLDDIVIWSQTLDEHRANVELVLDALRENSLFASRKKTQLFADEIKFLGHIISARGIEADGSKVEKVLNWPIPRNTTDVRAFLGLVRYLDKFLPNLAEHTRLLTPLTTKDAERDWPGWTAVHQGAFDAIKELVISRECLTTIDHNNMGDNKISVSTDASDWRTGAVLSYGPTLETSRPVTISE
ncbi:polyprotein [Phanerochaete sordida]|uniref:Polyprotein n=1 Tax=Phanerochaete sordida TaxID=48140 RepID=A0A9P3GSN6_9APHY|nr:polyprotein [Phanerochaete sordida]